MKNKLEEIRKERGITQEDLAKILEVSRQTVGSLENGRYNPSIILAFKIARYLKWQSRIFLFMRRKMIMKIRKFGIWVMCLHLFAFLCILIVRVCKKQILIYEVNYG